jgi:hypothetical protein
MKIFPLKVPSLLYFALSPLYFPRSYLPHVLQAVLAGELSLKQLALATDMDDPLLASKCKIFSAYSLLQRGKLKAASKIIK